jgi:serine/threonine protein phosphatase PrpC
LDEDPASWAVTSVPEVRVAEFVSGDILLLGCDGLFDVCDNLFVAKFVAAHLNSEEIANELCEEALKRGSDDNVTVVVVKL